MRIVIHHLESIEGVAIFPIIGILIFFGFFIGLVIYVFRMDKSHVQDLANSPFNNDNEQNEFLNKNTDSDHGTIDK